MTYTRAISTRILVNLDTMKVIIMVITHHGDHESARMRPNGAEMAEIKTN
jgi:hypothetical protein